MRLFREIRCMLSPGGLLRQRTGDVGNTWAGTTAAGGAAALWVLRALVEGTVDPKTGYLCDIKELDDLLRGPVLGRLSPDGALPGAPLNEIVRRLRNAFDESRDQAPAPARLVRLDLALSPFTTVSVHEEDKGMTRLTQSFEFAASHRLSCAGLSPQDNLRLFGKCSNPHGHGHNYIVEVTVIGSPGEPGPAACPDGASPGVANLPQIDRVVRERVIEPFDHKNLNLECPDFASINPTVENIAKAIWLRLEGRFDDCRLCGVRVWETPRTYAEYAGD